MRKLLRIGATLAVVLLVGTIVRLAVRIQSQSTRDEARPADVILILGAAEYRGRPSPVLKARLDHGFQLWEDRLAPRVMTTGGAGGDPVYTEGEVGRDYLVRRGVPSESIIVESEGATTAHSIAACSEILRRMGLRSAIVVSDGYHIFRVKKILEAQGFQVYGSPRPTHERNDVRQWWLYGRQAVGYLLWKAGLAI